MTWPVASDFATSDPAVPVLFLVIYQIPIVGYIRFLFLVISNSVISVSSVISDSVLSDSVISFSTFHISCLACFQFPVLSHSVISDSVISTSTFSLYQIPF